MERKKILIIDDDKDLLRGLSVRLKTGGYNIVFATDAISATTLMRKEEPDLIILDIGLPGGDGFVVMERIKMLPMPIPVIVLTARDSKANKERALKAGAEAFFQKPADNENLLASVRKALGEFE